MTIVRTTYRYERPPKKRKPNPAALDMPRIVTAKKPKPRRPGDPPIRRASDTAPSPDTTAPASEDCTSDAAPKSALVTARRPGKVGASIPAGLLPDTPEEHKQRGDAAAALWRELKRRITNNDDRS